MSAGFGEYRYHSVVRSTVNAICFRDEGTLKNRWIPKSVILLAHVGDLEDIIKGKVPEYGEDDRVVFVANWFIVNDKLPTNDSVDVVIPSNIAQSRLRNTFGIRENAGQERSKKRYLERLGELKNRHKDIVNALMKKHNENLKKKDIEIKELRNALSGGAKRNVKIRRNR